MFRAYSNNQREMQNRKVRYLSTAFLRTVPVIMLSFTLTLVMLSFTFMVKADTETVEAEEEERGREIKTKDAAKADTETAEAQGQDIKLASDGEVDQPVDDKREEYRMPGMTVIGSAERARDLPGSGQYLGTEEIRQQSYADINRVLRQVPGVYLREEDGFGLFPNISVRGTDPGRSGRTTLMEDGVLTAPAPYSDPAAYYSPTIARMSGIEVLKGSSQILYGPHITGGIVNYLSTPIPESQRGYIRTLYGKENEIRTHAHFGDTFGLANGGRFGYLVEGYYRHTEGFKDLDKTPDFRGDDTGFTVVEPMVKLMWEPNTAAYQRIEGRFGYTDLDADETYLGLSEEDFKKTPFRRYQASRFDNIDSEHYRTYLRHHIELTDDLNLRSTVYYNKFQRNWYKLNDIRNIGGTGENMSMSAALAGATTTTGVSGLDVLRGEEAGTLRVRANNREYYLWGGESVADYRFTTGIIDHTLTLGARYHHDRARRFQWQDDFTQEANGTISDMDAGIKGAQDNRIAKTDAIAYYLQDRLDFGKLAITLGIRHEYLQQRNENRNSGTSGFGDMHLISGGGGFTYDFDEQWTMFGGVHRGVSPPGPDAAINNKIKEETSIGTELGMRYTHAKTAFSGEVTGFFTHFDDLLVRESIGAGGIDDNAGRARIYGVELSMQWDAGIANDWGFLNPYTITYTYTDAELRSDDASPNPESIFSGGQKGSRIPYIPKHTLAAGTGLGFDRFSINTMGIYVDKTFTTASNTRQQEDPDGNPDARFGRTDSHFILDVSADYKLNKNAKIFGGVQNAFDREYVASRHPHGPRPGAPLFAYTGLEITF